MEASISGLSGQRAVVPATELIPLAVAESTSPITLISEEEAVESSCVFVAVLLLLFDSFLAVYIKMILPCLEVML